MNQWSHILLRAQQHARQLGTTQLCANLSVPFMVYPSLSLTQSSYLLLGLPHDLFPGTCPFSTAFSKGIVPVFVSQELNFLPNYTVQQPTFQDFKFICNRGIHPSLSSWHTQNFTVSFALECSDVLCIALLIAQDSHHSVQGCWYQPAQLVNAVVFFGGEDWEQVKFFPSGKRKSLSALLLLFHVAAPPPRK